MTRKEKLYIKIRKKVKRANQRLVRIERAFGKNSWGAKRLKANLDIDSLNAWTETGRTKISMKMTSKELEIVERALDDFLIKRKEISTVSGIKKRIKKMKAGIEEKIDVDSETADEIYSYFDDDNFKYLKGYFDTPSDLINIMEEAKEKNFDFSTFESRIKDIVEYGNDSWLKEKVAGVFGLL